MLLGVVVRHVQFTISGELVEAVNDMFLKFDWRLRCDQSCQDILLFLVNGEGEHFDHTFEYNFLAENEVKLNLFFRFGELRFYSHQLECFESTYRLKYCLNAFGRANHYVKLHLIRYGKGVIKGLNLALVRPTFGNDFGMERFYPASHEGLQYPE